MAHRGAHLSSQDVGDGGRSVRSPKLYSETASSVPAYNTRESVPVVFSITHSNNSVGSFLKRVLKY